MQTLQRKSEAAIAAVLPESVLQERRALWGRLHTESMSDRDHVIAAFIEVKRGKDECKKSVRRLWHREGEQKRD